MNKIVKYLVFFLISYLLIGKSANAAGEKQSLLKQDWTFQSFFGKFDRASLQRGYQVYTEVCASCHSMKYLSYRNLYEKGGPEFSEEQAKAIEIKIKINTINSVVMTL